MDHGVELPDRAQRGVRRGREVDAVDHGVELDAVDHGVEPSTTNQQTPFANRERILYFLLSSRLFLSKTDHEHWIQYFDYQKFDLIHRS
jgi:hypothetical protein